MRRGEAQAIGSHLVLENSNSSRLNSGSVLEHNEADKGISFTALLC